MLGVNDIWLFIISGVVLNIMPGPDSLYIVSRSASQGFKAGSSAAFGTASGVLVHSFIAALGLSAILTTSTIALTILKMVGCAYLVYLGFSTLIKNGDSENLYHSSHRNISLSKIFYQGFVTNILNPKVALFFLAFMPQFIDNDAPNKALAFLFLGLVFNINSLLWSHILAWSSSSLSVKIKCSELMTITLNRCAGCLFIGFGVKLAMMQHAF
ncbi:LysE family translocator [Vibrio caribbeanicus]|uniref:LysE family translocator n=1 Tax=Vibrio caribbeanicus TaxID=701175 RepID=UPI0030D9412A